MFQSLQNLFESTTPAMFYFWVAYFGFLLGLLLGFLFWFRHQLRYGRTQTKKRELVGEIAQLSAANQTMGEQLSSRGQTKPQVSESGSATGFGNQGSSRHESNESDSVTSDAFKSNSNPPGQLQVSAQSGQTTFGKSEGQGDHFDWSKVEGVSPGLAAQLKKMGIDNVEQIDNLSPADRESLEAKLAFEGYKWNWGWLSNWKTGAASAATIASGAIGAAGLAAASKLNATKPENLKINLPYSSAPKVDWSKVEGVDEKLAAELNSLGVKNIEQLKSLAGSERAKLEDRLKARGFNWNWSMLDRWKPQGFGQVSTTGSAEVSSAKASASSSISKTELESRLVKPVTANVEETSKPSAFKVPPHVGGGPEIDWTNVDGVDVKLAAEFNALGIKNFNQLNSLTNEQRDNLNSHLKSKGLSWNWSSAPNWEKTAQSTAASLGGVAKSAASADPKPKWNKEDFQHTSIPAPEANAVTKHLSQFENTNRTSRTPEQSDRPTDSTTKRNQTSSASLKQTDADGLKPVKGFAAGVGSSQSGSSQSGSSQSSTSQTSTSQSSTSQSETAQTGISSLGISLPQSEGPSLNWTTLRGVGGGTGNELNRLGIKNFEQLQSLSLMDRQKLGDHMRSKGLHWDWSSLMDLADGGDSTFSPPQAEVKPHSSTEAASSAGASIFAKGAIKKPEFKDDLTLLDGIEGPQAAALQKMGIFNFTQLHNLSLEDRAELQNSFRHRGWNLDMDQWRIASEGNTEHPTIEEIQRKAFEIYQDRDRKGFGGGERTDWEQAEWELRGNPIFSYGVPHDIDDFAVNLTGVTAEARDELYRMGLYNRGQLSELGHDARRLLTRWFAGPRFGVDLTQSFGWLSTMNSVPEDKDFGKVFAIRPTRVDDLSDINGVGGPTEHDLNRIGIYQFEQIANWTDDNIAAVDELLELDGRIQRDQWVVQARRIVDQNQ